MDKAPDAYRTISEVGEDLDIAQHVLRFWETRFPQIKPLKRGGGRRYYRPDDVELLKGIRHLLYREGYTIKGVQRILREQGLKDVMAVGRSGSIAALASELEPAWTPAFTDVETVAEPVLIALAPTPQVPVTPVPAEPVFRPSTAMTERAIAPKKPIAVESAMPLLDAMLPPLHPEVTPAPSQVSMFRGGLQRGQEMPIPVVSDAVMPDDGIVERKSRLRHALAELEACKAILAEHHRRAN